MKNESGSGSPRLLVLFYSVVLLAVFGLMVASFPVGLYVAYVGTLSSHGIGAMTPIRSFQLYAALSSFTIPFNGTLGELFAAAWALCLLAFAATALQRPSIFSTIRSAYARGSGALMENPFFGTTVVLSLVLLSTYVIDPIQSAAGLPTGGISGDAYSLLVSLSLAPLVEEFGFRFVMMGLPVFVFLLVARAPARRALLCLVRPSAAWARGAQGQEALAGAGAFRALAFLMLAISSVAFGLSHFLSGAGWGPGKISEAAIGGLGLGYLYIRYGLHAAVIGHWGVDYFSTIFAFLGQAAWHVPWDTNALNIFNTLPLLLTAVLVGVPWAYHLGYVFLRRLAEAPKQAAT